MDINLSPMAFESMFLLAFAVVSLFTGLFTAYFGVKKSRAIGIVLMAIGILVLLGFYYFIWTSADQRLVKVTGSAVLGAFIGFLVAVGLFLLAIMKSEPKEKKIKEPAEEIKVEKKPAEEIKEEIKEELPPEEVKNEPAPPVESEETKEEIKEELPPPEEEKPPEEVKEEAPPATPAEPEEKKPAEIKEDDAGKEVTDIKKKGGKKGDGKRKGRR